MNEVSENQTSVRLDRYAFKVVIDAFSYMIEHYNLTGVIDHAAWIIQKPELEVLVAKLKPYLERDQNLAIIPMTETEYIVYVRLIDYAGHAAPNREDRVLLETLYDAYLESEESQMPVYLTVTLPHCLLAQLVTIYEKIIDEPDILDASLYDLTPWDKFIALTTKLKTLLESPSNKVTIPLNFSEWTTQNAYSTQPLSRSDELTAEEEQVIIDVNFEITKVIGSIPRP